MAIALDEQASKGGFGRKPVFFGLLVFVALLLRPYPLDFIGSLGARAIDASIVLALFAYVLIVGLQQRLKFGPAAVLVCALLLMMTGLSLLSALYGMWQGMTGLDIRDIFDSLRYAQFSILIAFGYVLANDRRFSERLFLKAVLLVGFATLAFGLVQKVIPGPSYFLTQLYAPERQGSRIFTTERVTAFFGNPNTAALMMTGFILYVLSFLHCRGKAMSLAMQRALIMSLAAFFVFVLLTGSRTGLLTACGAIALYFMLTRPTWRWLIGLGVMAGGLFLFQDVILEQIRSLNVYLYAGLRLLLQGDWDSLASAGAVFRRFTRWEEAWSLFLQSPAIGLGPLRGVIGSATDNFYLYLLARVGLAGLLLYLSVVAAILSASVRLIRTQRSPFGYHMLLLTAAILAANLTLEAQILISMTYLYFVSAGVVLALAQRPWVAFRAQ